MPNLRKLLMVLLCAVCGTAAGQTYNTSKLFLEKLHGKDWVYNKELHVNVIADYKGQKDLFRSI
ncbi:MAG: hypothetical protein IKZ99_13375 [Salinivirgaceae bacterium]|nr:hypothetical protein [Salinivirgaceae bacterium]